MNTQEICFVKYKLENEDDLVVLEMSCEDYEKLIVALKSIPNARFENKDCVRREVLRELIEGTR